MLVNVYKISAENMPLTKLVGHHKKWVYYNSDFRGAGKLLFNTGARLAQSYGKSVYVQIPVDVEYDVDLEKLSEEVYGPVENIINADKWIFMATDNRGPSLLRRGKYWAKFNLTFPPADRIHDLIDILEKSISFGKLEDGPIEYEYDKNKSFEQNIAEIIHACNSL